MTSALGKTHTGLKIVFCFMHATPYLPIIIIIIQICIKHIRWEIPEACVNTCWNILSGLCLKCSSFSRLPSSFSSGWGCMCCTGPLYVNNSSYCHRHQIGSINLSHWCHIFRVYVLEVVVPSYASSLCSLTMCANIEYIMAWWSYSFVYTLHHLIIIIMRAYLKILNYKCCPGAFCRVCV